MEEDQVNTAPRLGHAPQAHGRWSKAEVGKVNAVQATNWLAEYACSLMTTCMNGFVAMLQALADPPLLAVLLLVLIHLDEIGKGVRKLSRWIAKVLEAIGSLATRWFNLLVHAPGRILAWLTTRMVAELSRLWKKLREMRRRPSKKGKRPPST